MDNQQKAFFFETQKIPENSVIFDQFQKQRIFFSYFQVDGKYYLFFYEPKSIDINFLYQSVDVLQELDKKQRKLRSFRGFLLYALDIIETGKDVEILNTNLHPFFWKKVKAILRQNQKQALLTFLFGSQTIVSPTDVDMIKEFQSLKEKMEGLQKEVDFLKKMLLEGPNRPVKALSHTQQGDYTLKSERSRYLLGNANKINREGTEPESLSEAPKIPLEPLSESQQYNITSASQIPKFKQISANQEKAQNRLNFITSEDNFVDDVWRSPGTISEQEKIEIIQRGFQLQAKGKISLKKYYESTDPNSLFQSKGYSIKYESIRRTKFYQNLKL